MRGARRGQANLEYVLIFVLIVLIMFVVLYLVRGKIMDVASGVSGKIAAFGKDEPTPAPTATPGKGTGASKTAPGGTAAAGAGAKGTPPGGGAPGTGQAGKGGLQAETVDNAPPEEDPGANQSLPFVNLGIAQQIFVVGALVGTVLGVLLFVKQLRRN
ncbi:MAG: hypothetical protein U0166_07810 [Acidobacteriota bacterium]